MKRPKNGGQKAVWIKNNEEKLENVCKRSCSIFKNVKYGAIACKHDENKII